MDAQPLLTVCIPSYNGGKHLLALISTLLLTPESDFEVVVSDDCSSDGSWEAACLVTKSDPRFRCERNAVNLGMDGNFAHCVSLARGHYVWFSGQDDEVDPAGLERVLDLLRHHPEIDFILMNHAKRVLGRHGERVAAAAQLDEHVFGIGLDSYVAHTRHHLPTFLPTYLIHTELWRSVDVSRYFGTCYCQVGVFLEAARNIHWCHFAGNHVVGLLPADGWQANPVSYARIALGHFAMLARARERSPWIHQGMLHAFFRLQKRRLVYSFLLMRHHRLALDPTLVQEVLTAIQPYADVYRPVRLVQRMPRLMSSIALALIEARRALRALVPSTSSS